MIYTLLFVFAMASSVGAQELETCPERASSAGPANISEATKQFKVIDVGILNRKARKLPKAVYSKAAKAAGASGEVRVEVMVDILSGKVTEARAISGLTLLQPLAVEAARKAEFDPVIYTGQLARAKGILIYNFALSKRRRT